MQEMQETWFSHWWGRVPGGRAWQPSPEFLPGKSHGQRNWWAIVHEVAKRQTRVKWLSTWTCTLIQVAMTIIGSYLRALASHPCGVFWPQALLLHTARRTSVHAGSPISGPWSPGSRQSYIQLTVSPSCGFRSVYPTWHLPPGLVSFSCTPVRSLKTEFVPSSLLTLQGLAQGMPLCSIKVCEMNE